LRFGPNLRKIDRGLPAIGVGYRRDSNARPAKCAINDTAADETR
jgi:hypothetical protein